jgi:hypothetical protein
MFVIALIVSHGMTNLFNNLYQEWSTPCSGKQPRQGGRGGRPGRGVVVVREGRRGKRGGRGKQQGRCDGDGRVALGGVDG